MPDFDIESFCENAEIYSVNSSVWLIDEDEGIATHCSDTTYNNSDWNAVYPPTSDQFVEFLGDENWFPNTKG